MHSISGDLTTETLLVFATSSLHLNVKIVVLGVIYYSAEISPTGHILLSPLLLQSTHTASPGHEVADSAIEY